MTQGRLRVPGWLSALLGVCILALGIAWAGVGDVLSALAEQELLALVLAVAAIAAGTFLGAWNAFRLSELASTMAFRSFLAVYWRAWAIGLSVPGQVGDLVSTLWQLRGRVDMEFVAGRLLVDKSVTLGCMLLLLSSLPAVLGILAYPYALLPPVGAAIVLMLALAVSRRLALSQTDFWTSHRFLRRIKPLVSATAVPWPALWTNVAFTAAKVLLTGSAYWLLLPSDGNLEGFFTVLAISQTAGLVAYLPISFNGIGTVELSAMKLFSLMGYAAPEVLSAYIVLRLCALATAWIPSSLMSLWPVPARRVR